MAPSTDCVSDALLDERALSRLRWRCRRGMLENDLFVERFFHCYAATLTLRQAEGLAALMDLGDNDLLDLLLGRKMIAQVDGLLDRADIVKVLGMLRENR